MELLKGLDETIQKAMKKMNVPGVQIAVVKSGEVIYQKAFGYADLEKGEKLTNAHLLPIGSSSKSFTAACVVKLCEQGKWDLDTPLKKYMPAFSLYDPVATEQATARDLLCHRTGVPRHDMMWYNWNDLDRKDLTVNRMPYLEANTPFRSTFQYSNQMYAVIGQFIEEISKKPWEMFVEEHFLQPLNIEHYSFAVNGDEQPYASLYTPDEEGVNQKNAPLKLKAIAPAGGLNMTAGEFVKWVDFQMHNGHSQAGPLLSEQSMVQLHTPNIPYQIFPFSFPERMNVGYALGWTVDMFRGKKVIDHGGNVNGASALAAFMPEEALGIAILTNANSNMLVYALSMEIFDRYLGHEGEKDWFTAFQSNMDALLAAMKGMLKGIYQTKKEGKGFSHSLEEYTGLYTHPGYGEVRILLDEGKLKGQYHNNALDIQHLHYDIFTFELMGTPFPISFFTAVDGQISKLEIPLEMAVQPIAFTKVE